nr:MAG TPA: hypothetical protein [Herelleviridae sp.]
MSSLPLKRDNKYPVFNFVTRIGGVFKITQVG